MDENRVSQAESHENVSDTIVEEPEIEIQESKEDNETSSPYDMAILTDEETGEQWCTIKYAAKLTGLSYSTIRRYTKDGRLKYRTEDSPFGRVNYVRISDIENYKAAYDLDKAKRGVRAGDYQFEMTSYIRSAFAPSISEIHKALDKLEDTQSELSRSINEENESRRAQFDKINAQNEELISKIGELSEIIARQETAINELKTAAEKKSFWNRLFGKKGSGNTDPGE